MSGASTTISFELLDFSGNTVEHGEMPWFYVQPRIVKWQGNTYVLLSDALHPGTDKPLQYIMINSGGTYEPQNLELPDDV